MMRAALSRIGNSIAGLIRRVRGDGFAPAKQPPEPAVSSGAGVARYVRIHPKMAALLGVALRGWEPGRSKRRRRLWSKPHQGARECARRVSQMQRGMLPPPYESERELQRFIERRRLRVLGELARECTPAVVGLAVLLSMTGCGVLPEMSRTEKAWQALHAVDAVTTYDAARDPCFEERHAVTRGLIGANPSGETVLAWWAGTSLLHAHATSWIEEHAPRLLPVWHVIHFADTGTAVANNFSIGIRIGAKNKTPSGCVR